LCPSLVFEDLISDEFDLVAPLNETYSAPVLLTTEKKEPALISELPCEVAVLPREVERALTESPPPPSDDEDDEPLPPPDGD
jgi:hypothetical protein